MKYEYDIIVIGSGSAGLTAAKTAKGFGKNVAMIEKREYLGGDCTWFGCIPSKSLIRMAQECDAASDLARCKIKKVPEAVNARSIMREVQKVIRTVYQTHTPDVIRAEGIDVLFGDAQFIDAHTIRLDNKTITAKNFVIATGSHPFIPPIEGLESISYLTNETIFSLEQLPESLIILGGGPIGIEMSSALNRLGVAVTVVEMQDSILSHEDSDCVALLSNVLTKEGVKIKTGLRATKVEKKDTNISVICKDKNDNEVIITAQQLLVAVGRRPSMDGLGFDEIGVQTTKKGIVVDAYMRTSVKNISAAGDVVGPYNFSHMAWYQAVTAVRNICLPFYKQKISYEHAIWATFSDPELATIGLTESAARHKLSNNVCVYTRGYDTIDRAQVDRIATGMIKVICDKKGYIVGATMLGPRAGDVIHELQVAKVHGIPFYKLYQVIHAYPTYAEIIWHLSKEAYLDRIQNNFFVRLLKKYFW